MTNNQKETRDFLNRNYLSFVEVKQLTERVEMLADRVNNCISSYRPREIQQDGGINNREAQLCILGDNITELQNRIEELNYKDKQTMMLINKCDDVIARTILICRYVNRLPWKEIQSELALSHTSVNRYHLKGLDLIHPYLPKSANNYF